MVPSTCIASFGLKPASSEQPVPSCIINACLEAFCFLVQWECLGVSVPRESGSSAYLRETPFPSVTTDDDSDTTKR